MSDIRKKLAALLLMLSLIVCQSPLIAIANDAPANEPAGSQQEQQSTVPAADDEVSEEKNDTATPAADDEVSEEKNDTADPAADEKVSEEKTDAETSDEKEDASAEEGAKTEEKAGADKQALKSAPLKLGAPLKAPAGATKELRVWTPGHGKVLVKGQDYGTEHKGTWDDGTEVEIEAVPDTGYKFDFWWIENASGSGARDANAKTKVTAGTNPSANAYFGLETASLTITPPAAGQTAATAPAVTLPSGAGYEIHEGTTWDPGLAWVESSDERAAVLGPSTEFEAGKTYYAKVRIRETTDSFGATAGGSTFNTDLAVTGGTKVWQANSAHTEEVSGGGTDAYVAIKAIIAVTVPESTPTQELKFTFTNSGTGSAVPLSDLLSEVTVNGSSLPIPTSGMEVSGHIPAGTGVTAVLKATDDAMFMGGDSTHNPVLSQDMSTYTFKFTMPASDETISVMMSKAVKFIYDANGGTKGPGWQGDEVKVPANIAAMMSSWYVDPAPVNTDTGENIVLPPAGHKYAGIEITDKNGTHTGKPGERITGLDLSQGCTFKYLWVKNHTVTFDAQGGTPVPDAQTVKDGENATKPADPSKTGLYLRGWFEKPGAELSRDEVYAGGFKFADTPITEDKKLYAVWYAGFYGATYDLSAATPKYAETGGTTTFTSTYAQKTEPSRVWWDYSIIQGSQVTITAIPEEGSHFVGWAPATLDANNNMPDNPPSRDDIVSTENPYTFTFSEKTALAALFERDKVTIKFNTHGGIPEPVDQVINVGEKATKPETDPAQDSAKGLSFRCWNLYAPKDLTYERISNSTTAEDKDGGIFDFAGTPITKDVTLHAIYEGILSLIVHDVTSNASEKGGKVTASQLISRSAPDPWTNQQTTQIAGTKATLTAIPDEGYKFAGWSTSTSKDDIISTDTTYEYPFETKASLYALFEEKPPVLTLHWSSMDGLDLMDPIKITVPKGTTFAQALEQYKPGTTPTTPLFEKEGYRNYNSPRPKPITKYDNKYDLWSDGLDSDTAINADMDVYYIMIKEIDKIDVSIEAPLCGTETSVPDGGFEWTDQTNPPSVSSSGENYELDTKKGNLPAIWVLNKDNDPYEGSFKGGKDYLASVWFLANFGYCFAENPSITVNGGTLLGKDNFDDYLDVFVQVTAEHDWSAWEVTKEPTETEDGLEERTCKTVDCGAHEERVIPKLVVEYRFTSGDGSSWTKGSTEKLNFIVKRNRADEKTIEHFKGLKVDGKDVPSSGYTAKAGSVVIDLMPAYLETLADGDHTLTAVFDDGNKETSANFKVVSATDKGSKDKADSSKKKGSPDTGDQSRGLMWLMILCTAGLALSDRIIRRLKGRSADR